MTELEAKQKIESFFGKVDPTVYNSRIVTFPPAEDKLCGYRLVFETFTQDGRHSLGVGDITPRDTADEALEDMVREVEKNANKKCILFWREYPRTYSDYDINTMKWNHSATCRITWFDPSELEAAA